MRLVGAPGRCVFFRPFSYFDDAISRVRRYFCNSSSCRTRPKCICSRSVQSVNLCTNLCTHQSLSDFVNFCESTAWSLTVPRCAYELQNTPNSTIHPVRLFQLLGPRSERRSRALRETGAFNYRRSPICCTLTKTPRLDPPDMYRLLNVSVCSLASPTWRRGHPGREPAGPVPSLMYHVKCRALQSSVSVLRRVEEEPAMLAGEGASRDVSCSLILQYGSYVVNQARRRQVPQQFSTPHVQRTRSPCGQSRVRDLNIFLLDNYGIIFGGPYRWTLIYS